MKHTISVLVENKFGVLARISGLFSARGFNINSLAVGETQDPTVSRMTIVVEGDDRILEQVTKQLNKLIDVVRVQDLTKEDFIDRELILVKIRVSQKSKSKIIEGLNRFPARVVDEVNDILSIEICGDKPQTEETLKFIEPFGIEELVRTGRIAMGKGKILSLASKAKRQSK